MLEPYPDGGVELSMVLDDGRQAEFVVFCDPETGDVRLLGVEGAGDIAPASIERSAQ